MRTLLVFMSLIFLGCSSATADERPPKAMINIVFGLDPGVGKYDGVAGKPKHTWNLMDVGMTRLDALKNSKGNKTSISLSMSENDGEWGIKGHQGIFHAYLYHNSRDVDLQVAFDGLTAGSYRVYVYAHGDHPDQNAKIELEVGNESYGKKTTLDDGSWDFRSKDLKEGNQYVTFEFTVADDAQVRITSHRDGSAYSMFNAIQIVPLKNRRRTTPSR
ncbi:MAG: hypothetical protein ACR2OA_21070 [Rubripirellula sp.]